MQGTGAKSLKPKGFSAGTSALKCAACDLAASLRLKKGKGGEGTFY